jgi:hypothetical protein
MIDHELGPDDPLQAVIGTLQEGVPVAPGLPGRARRRARRRTVRRWTAGSLSLAAAAALVLLISRPARNDPGQVTFTLALAAPASEGVSLVGDFNDWERDKIRLAPDGRDHWKVTVKLPPGRYRYSYVTDDGTWLSDPDAPPALDEFGTPTSVVTVTGE